MPDPQRNKLTMRSVILLMLWAGTSVGADSLDDYYGFGPMEILKLEWEIGPLLATDLNQDSYCDLVVCNNRKARIELLLQKPDFDPNAVETAPPAGENINDVFGREAAWRFTRFPYPLYVRATSLVAADLNHDGHPDLAYYCDQGLRVALQDAASETSDSLTEPAWKAETRFDVRDGLGTAAALTAGDINDDGRTDLVLLTRDGYYVLLQDADGRLARPARHYSASANLRQAEIGDVNGDGRADLVLLAGDRQERPLLVRLQNADGSLGPESSYALPAPSFLRLCTLGDQARGAIASVSRQSGRFSLHVLAETGRRGEVVSNHPLPSDDEAGKRDTVGADVDGDGLADLVVTEPGRGQFLVLPGRADGSFGSATAFPGLKGMQKVCAARLDESSGDALVVLSIDEKLIAVSRFENGRLQFPQTIMVEGEPQAMAITDLDRDGQADLAYIAKGSSDGDDAFVLRSILSLGRSTARPGPSTELTQVEGNPQDLIACDIDLDGDMDLIVVRRYDPLLLVRQTAPQTFEQQAEDRTHSGLVSNLDPRALSLAPLGPNGSTVLLAALGDFARSLYFDAEKGWQVIDQYHAADRRRQIRVAACGAASSGGAPSIIGYDDVSGIVSIMEPQSEGTYRVTRELDVGTAAIGKILTGRSADGTESEYILCGQRRAIHIRTGDTLELQQIAGFETDIEDGRFGYVTTGDLNSDGIPDIVLAEQNRNHVQVLSFDSDAQLVDACKFKVFETHPAGAADEGLRADRGEPRQVVVADVTGDGRDDLILLVHDRIIVYPQDF